MKYEINCEIGRKQKSGTYVRAWFFDSIVEGQTTIDQLFEMAEAKAKEMCERRGLEYVELMINGLSKSK